MLRAQATSTLPLLVPNAIPAQWTIHVLIDEHGAAPDEITLWFSDAQSKQVVELSIAGSKVLLPTPHTEDSDPNFRGDTKSYYRVADIRDATSDRKLVWFEPISLSQRGSGGTGYALTTSGLTNEEFWLIANSLDRVAP